MGPLSRSRSARAGALGAVGLALGDLVDEAVAVVVAVTARWTYQGIHLVAEYDGAWALRRVFVYATRGHVPDYVAQGDGSGGRTLYRVVTDPLGSVRRVVRVSDGVVMQHMRYDVYGRGGPRAQLRRWFMVWPRKGQRPSPTRSR